MLPNIIFLLLLVKLIIIKKYGTVLQVLVNREPSKLLLYTILAKRGNGLCPAAVNQLCEDSVFANVDAYRVVVEDTLEDTLEEIFSYICQ